MKSSIKKLALTKTTVKDLALRSGVRTGALAPTTTINGTSVRRITSINVICVPTSSLPTTSSITLSASDTSTTSNAVGH
jgi:hypothetical protein